MMDCPYMKLDAGEQIILEQPNFEELQEKRFQRNRNVMKTIDPSILTEVLPQQSQLTSEEKAAVCIQKHYRGYLGRQQYYNLLFEKCLEDEKMRTDKMTEQVEEGELLIENHKLEVLLDDNATTRRNRDRNYLSKVLTIQRGWRAYRKRKLESMRNNLPEDEDVSKSDSESEYSETESTLGMQTMTVLTPEENQPVNISEVNKGSYKLVRDKTSPIKSLINSECDSVLSDYSEIAGPLEDIENELDMYIVDRSKLKTGDFILHKGENCREIKRVSGETDIEFAKRARKINILSLAQEFAELKKIDSHALPFDLHNKGQRLQTDVSGNCDENSCSESEEYETESAMTSPIKHHNSGSGVQSKMNPGFKQSKSDFAKHKTTDNERKHVKDKKTEVDSMTSSSGDFDVYNIESALPQMDWATLEQQLQLAAEEERKRLLAHHNDREEIRRKLAMGTDEEICESEKSLKKPSLQSRMHGGMNLQICFMNEGTDNETELPAAASLTSTDQTSTSHFQSAHGSKPTTNLQAPEDEDDFFKKQAKLQDEAKIALAQACTMAHMQLEVEKQLKKKSAIADMVGIPSSGDGRWRKINHKVLDDMNIAQLQVLVNDLHSQIENLNDELVQMLIERDDLHMEQDSMLVDIEDLTRRAQDVAQKLNNNNTTCSKEHKMNKESSKSKQK